MKHLADIITSVRIAAAVLIMFTSPLSIMFFVFYTVGGISDTVDGTVARKFGSSGSFGAKLDSAADLIFLFSAVYKLLPSLWLMLPRFSLWAVAAIILIKIISSVICICKFRKLCFLHTYLNKLTGMVVFLLPYFIKVNFFDTLIFAVCAVAFIAATEELFCTIRMKEYNAEIKGLFA